MNQVFLLRQSCGENRCPEELRQKGQTCVLPTPLTAVCTLLWPVPSRLLVIIIQNRGRKEKLGRTFLAQQSPWSSPFTDDAKSLLGWGCSHCCCFVLHLDCVSVEFWPSRGWTLGFSVATFLLSNYGKTPPFILPMGLHWHQSELKFLPFPLLTETERDMLEVLLKTSECVCI